MWPGFLAISFYPSSLNSHIDVMSAIYCWHCIISHPRHPCTQHHTYHNNFFGLHHQVLFHCSSSWSPLCLTLHTLQRYIFSFQTPPIFIKYGAIQPVANRITLDVCYSISPSHPLPDLSELYPYHPIQPIIGLYLHLYYTVYDLSGCFMVTVTGTL